VPDYHIRRLMISLTVRIPVLLPDERPDTLLSVKPQDKLTCCLITNQAPYYPTHSMMIISSLFSA
jgi:hypothetical protein